VDGVEEGCRVVEEVLLVCNVEMDCSYLKVS
jgi:hypothetical protein